MKPTARYMEKDPLPAERWIEVAIPDADAQGPYLRQFKLTLEEAWALRDALVRATDRSVDMP